MSTTDHAGLLPGTLDMLILKAVSLGKLHGYGVLLRIEQISGGALHIQQGALYPVLRNMSASGLLTSRVVPSYSGPPRRYYRITPLGREVLAAWRQTWSATRSFVDAIVAPPNTQET